MPIEKRFIETDEIEIRSTTPDGGNEQKSVSGVGIVYNREAEIWPGFFERIKPGAFTRSISSNREIKSFFNHDPNAVLSTTRSDPKLTIEDTAAGLRFDSPIPPTTYGNDLKINLERKNVRGASFSFSVNDEGDIITRDEKGVYHREIISGELYEVGPVTNPAYPQTKVGLRGVETLVQEMRTRYESTQTTPKPPVEDVNKLRKLNLSLLERGA